MKISTPNLHVYGCESMSIKIMVLILKNSMTAIADLLTNYGYVVKFKTIAASL